MSERITQARNTRASLLTYLQRGGNGIDVCVCEVMSLCISVCVDTYFTPTNTTSAIRNRQHVP